MENWFLKQAVRYGIDRLREPSTWAAIAAAISLDLHWQPSPDLKSAFITLGVAFAAFLGVIMKEGVRK